MEGSTDESTRMSARSVDDQEADAAHHSDAKSTVRKLMGARVFCFLLDGRQVTGRLVCVDRLKNLVLTDCVEERTVYARDYHPAPEKEDDHGVDGSLGGNDDAVAAVARKKNATRVVQRRLAQAMVPGSQLKSIEIDRDVFLARTLRQPEDGERVMLC